MAIEIAAFAAFLSTAATVKAFDPKAARALAPQPLAEDDLAKIREISPEDKWPDQFRRTVRLGGDRMNAIDKEAEAILASEEGALLKAKASAVAAKLADVEIETPRADGASDTTHRSVIRNAAVKDLKAWKDAHEAGRKASRDDLAKVSARKGSHGFSPEDLAKFRDLIGAAIAML